VNWTASVIVGRVDGIVSLAEKPHDEIFTPRENSFVKGEVSADIPLPQGPSMLGEYLQGLQLTFRCSTMAWSSSLSILAIWFGSVVKEEFCAVCMTQSDGVEQRCAPVVVYHIHFCPTQSNQRFQTVRVTSTGSAVESWEYINIRYITSNTFSFQRTSFMQAFLYNSASVLNVIVVPFV